MHRYVMTLVPAVIVGAMLAAGAATGGEGDPPADAEARAPDLGAGERVVLVVGGAFSTRPEAEAVASSQSFGDIQGYYVAPASQFVGLGEAIGAHESDHVLVSAFRTEEGAQEFASLARAAGAAAVVTPRLENLGLEYVGLGQEAHPDGSGPLTGPLPGVSVP